MIAVVAACDPGDATFDVVVVPDVDVPAFARVRLEIGLADGTGVWERTLRGAGTVTIAPGSPWAGSIRVWTVDGPAEAPIVVGYGVRESGTPGARRVEVEVHAAGDRDADWAPDDLDNCPDRWNPRQLDGDVGADGGPAGDGVGDACDVCPLVPDPGQEDDDGDGVGDACEAHVCGDGVREGPETCDDGNVEAGDGCSPACRLEECGNGVVDPGEACDDGDGDDRDDCSNACRHVPALVAAGGAVRSGTLRAGESGDGRLLLGWTAEVEAVGGGDGRLWLAAADATSGAPGETLGAWRAPAPVPLALAPTADEASFGVVWRDVVADPPPGTVTVRAGEVASDLATATAATFAVVEHVAGPMGGVGSWDGVPAWAIHFGGAWDEPTRGAWIDCSSWPPTATEPVASVGFTGTASVAGMRRAAGGWIVVWAGRPERPGAIDGLWMRRFDGARVPVDPDEIRLPWDEPVQTPWVLYDGATDAYLVGVAPRSGDASWFRLAPGGGPIAGPIAGPAIPVGATFAAEAAGTFVAAWLAAEGGTQCVLHAQRIDGYGRPEGVERTRVVSAGAGLSACSGAATTLADGRALVTWEQTTDDGGGPTSAVGWWLVASPGALVETP